MLPHANQRCVICQCKKQHVPIVSMFSLHAILVFPINSPSGNPLIPELLSVKINFSGGLR
jgi:hypothetical protein